MDIELDLAKEEFLNYTEKYDLKDENIKRKQVHSLRVMENSKIIAEKLELSQEEVKLAALIGLLHDIARFEQYTRFQTYRDVDSFDHGDYALKILEIDLRKYIKDNRFDKIIKIAIKNHNKFQIEKGLTTQEELFAKIIRDADKIDILYEAVDIFWKGQKKEIEDSTISKEVFESIKNKELIKRSKDKKFNKLESIMTYIAFVFDINFSVSFEILYKENYINRILNGFDYKDRYVQKTVDEVREIANNYIKEEIKKI
jgi:HD superfamily phosphodiesterase